MKTVFEWSPEKNQKLMAERGISFDAVVLRIEEGGLRDVVPGKGKYRHQKQFIVEINRYIYIVPFVEQGEKIFLKTVIPSRKLTREYLSGGEHEEASAG